MGIAFPQPPEQMYWMSPESTSNTRLPVLHVMFPHVLMVVHDVT